MKQRAANNISDAGIRQDGVRKVAVLFFCHIVNNYTISVYEKLVRELGNNHCVYWIFQKDNVNRETALMLDNVNLFEFDIKSLNSLGYRKVQNLYGNDHYVVEYFFKEHPGYVHYWMIEYDVYFSGNWRTLMESFANSNSDLISAHIEKKAPSNEKWCWWNSIDCAPQFDSTNKVLVKSFNPICRLSNRALHFLNEYLNDKHNYGFYDNIVLNNFCVRSKMQNGNTLQKSQQFNPPMQK